jgi:hypothetical protein
MKYFIKNADMLYFINWFPPTRNLVRLGVMVFQLLIDCKHSLLVGKISEYDESGIVLCMCISARFIKSRDQRDARFLVHLCLFISYIYQPPTRKVLYSPLCVVILRRLKGAVLRMTPRPHVTVGVVQQKIPPCSKALRAEHRPKVCIPSPVMLLHSGEKFQSRK